MEVNGYQIEPGADLNGANLTGVNLSGADLTNADLITADLTNADLRDANLAGADLTNADLSWANLSGANLNGAYLTNADLSWANLSGADLRGVNLTGVILRSADLSGVNLGRVNLSGVNLSGVNLSGVNLGRVNLSGVDLTGVNLMGVNFTGPSLSGINLDGADLRGVNLSGVNLGRENLSGVDLTGVNLMGVNFTGPSLSGINLDGADLRGATVPEGSGYKFCDDCGAELLDDDDEELLDDDDERGHLCLDPDWRAAGFDYLEAMEWPEAGVNLRQAKAWRTAGFYPDGGPNGEPDVCGWLAWGCTPKQAVEYFHQGCEEAPWDGLKKLGISLEDAVFFQLNSVEWDDVDYLLDKLLPLGLSPKKIVKLKSQLIEASEEFENMCLEDEDFKGDFTSSFEDSLPVMFESLKSVGLPINEDNLKKYWQLSGEQILKVIDYGDESRLVSRIIRQGVPANKIGIAERLVELGMTCPSAASLVKHGLTLKHLKLLEKKNKPEEVLWELDDFLDSYSDIKIEEYLLWLEVPGGISWRHSGFTPQEAAKWSEKGFSPKMATRWRDAGVNSPVTAKRRQDAGLNP